MGVKEPKQYTKEYKLSALELSKKLKSVAEAAKSLGISAKNIYSWQKQLTTDKQDAFRGKGRLTIEDEKWKRLENENRRLKMENDFLKKAASYFAAAQR